MKNVTPGSSYTDSVTGLVGAATAECQYINRETSDVKLERLSSDGKLVSEWVDSSRLTLNAPSAA